MIVGAISTPKIYLHIVQIIQPTMSDATGHLPFFAITAVVGAAVGAVVGGISAAKEEAKIFGPE